MHILFVVSSHNGLSQRLQCELQQQNHQIEIFEPSSPESIVPVVDRYKPDLIVAPFLKMAIPNVVWQNYVCLILHPGIKGDRGPSSLDWAIMKDLPVWGVTVLQAAEEMDAGDIWATAEFERPEVSKSMLYRHEVTTAAIKAIHEAISNFQNKDFKPESLDYSNPKIKGRWNDPVKRKDRAFDWSEASADIIRKVRAADSNPGLLETRIFDQPYFMYGAHAESIMKGTPGEIIAKRDGAICVGTGDGSLWISHLKARQGGIKRKAAKVMEPWLNDIPEVPLDPFDTYPGQDTFREIWVEEEHEICTINFEFYNGAMSAEQCSRLKEVFLMVSKRKCKVIILNGGSDIWSNGIDLNEIESSENPADESWENITAMNDLVAEIINCDSKLVIAAIAGNAGAGGAVLALAADFVYAREGVVLNPHYQNMGLYGSEFWTYLMPKRVGNEKTLEIMQSCQPIVASEAVNIGLLDDCFGESVSAFRELVMEKVTAFVTHAGFEDIITNKKVNRLRDESEKPLMQYAEEELTQMRTNFYMPDAEYHFKRHFFVFKVGTEEQKNSDWKIVNFRCEKVERNLVKV